MAPPFDTGANALHVPSGVAEFPRRTASATEVPAGAVEANERAAHVTGDPASRTRDVKVPLDAYGDMRSQSTLRAVPFAVKSLTSGRMLAPSASGRVSTTAPSTEKTIWDAAQ